MKDEPQIRTDAWGNKIWYMHGKFHNTNGPAIENADGSKEWYVDDCLCCSVDAWARAALMYENMDVNEEAVQQKIQQVMQCDLFN